MRSNRIPILRCAVGEGKSGQRGGSGFEHAKKDGEGPRAKCREPNSRREILRELGNAEDLFRQVGSDRNAESLPLISFHHQQNPQDKGDQPQDRIEKEPQRKRASAGKPSCKQRSADKHAQDNVQDRDAAENHHGLRGVEADEGPLVDEVENDPGDPAENVAKEAREVFIHLAGGCNDRRRWRGRRRSGRRTGTGRRS